MSDIPVINPITKAELIWIEQQLRAANEFAVQYFPNCANQPLSLASLDLAFKCWLDAGDNNSFTVNNIVNAIGVAFGNSLVENAGFSWVISSDQYGTDLAILALPGQGDVLVYPANFVAKRLEKKETLFLETAFMRILNQTKELEARLSIS